MVENINYISELLKDSPIGMLIVDENSNIVMCNDFLFKLFEIKPVNYIGKRFGNIFNCINVGQEGLLCGTSARCKVCNLRNSIFSVLEEKKKIKTIPVIHEYFIGDKMYERKLSVSAKIIKDNGSLNSLVTIQDVTDIDHIEKSLQENRIKYKQLFENMTQAFALHEIVTDEKGNPIDYIFLDVNKEYERVTELKKEEIIGKKISEMIPANDDYSIKEYGEVALKGTTIRLEKYYSRINKYFDVFAYSPQKGQFVNILTDITERVILEHELRESELKFKSYFDIAPVAIFVIDKFANIMDVNNSAMKVTRYNKNELLNMKIFDIMPNESKGYALELFEKVIKFGKFNFEFEFTNKNGEFFIFNINIIKYGNDRYIGYAKNLTKEVEFKKKLEYEYYHDNMTGLYKRKYIFDHLLEIDNKNNLPLALATADINGLRIINESFGNLVGDKIIMAVANAIKSVSGEFKAFRWSGDDFLIVLPKTNFKVLNNFIKNLKVEIYKQLPEELKKIKISFGSYVKISEDITCEQALSLAEKNLLENKTTSSGSIHNTPIDMILHTLHEKNIREEMHSKRVSKICVAIGKEMKFEKDDLNKLKIIGLIHDIGKIGIDEYILNKPGKLTRNEFEVIKKHPEIGFRILSANKNTTELAFYILSHHERPDGTGYPNGIKGNDISIITRILTIADSYDAMTSQRTYRDTLTKEEAIGEMLKYSGTQFDGKIVDVFINKVLTKAYDFNVK